MSFFSDRLVLYRICCEIYITSDILGQIMYETSINVKALDFYLIYMNIYSSLYKNTDKSLH